MNNKLIIGTLIALLALMATGVFVAWHLATPDMRITSSLVDVHPYRPTSRWVADGVDPDVTTFEMNAPPQDSKFVDVDALAQNFVQQHSADLMPCYARALEEADVSGKLAMRFGVQPTGDLGSIEVTASELEDPELEACAVDTAKNWRLAPTGRETLLKFDADFTFSYE